MSTTVNGINVGDLNSTISAVKENPAAALLLVGPGCTVEPPRGLQAPPASLAGSGASAVQAPPSAAVPEAP